MNRDRARSTFVCQECGAQSPKWAGRCPQCGQWNTLANVPLPPRSKGNGRGASGPTQVQELSQVTASNESRAVTPSGELNRVLGGGVVPGSLVLMAGEPGIGKSTLLLQTCAHFARSGQRVLYVSGEESAHQVKLRAERLEINGQNLLFLAETEVDEILAHLDTVNPSLAVIDSVQTLFSQEMPSASGTVAQIRESTRRLMHWSKGHGVPLLLAGHVTKDGSVAGPRVLEHIVDVVLYLEGDALSPYRILRGVKNRFGSTNEVGVFAMSNQGMQDIEDPSMLFLAHSHDAMPGSTVIATLEGSRTLLAEVQALTTPTVFAQPRRTASGVDFQRLVLVAAVMSKRLGIPLGTQDIIVNIASGLHVEEPAADLGIALALLSSFRNQACAPSTVVIGEVGLGGEIRRVPQLDRRLSEAAKLGFKRAVIPEAQRPDARDSGLELFTASTVGEAADKVLPRARRQQGEKRKVPAYTPTANDFERLETELEETEL